MTDLMNKTFVSNGGATEDGKWRYQDANNLVTELENAEELVKKIGEAFSWVGERNKWSS